MVNYLVVFEKVIRYIRAYKRSIVPVIMVNDSIRINADMRE